jgi:hypothetical protein
MSSDEETSCGVCGTSFSEVPDRTSEGSELANTRSPYARRVLNHDSLVKLGAWLALVVSGLGLNLLTLTNRPPYGSFHYYRFAGRLSPIEAGFVFGVVLIVLAFAWASVRLRP